jgi:hypothetical protein
MPAINNPPSIHQAKKRRKARKGVSFWLETEEGKGRPLQKQNTQMWPISRGGNRGPGKRRWNHTIPQRKTRLQATKIFNAQDERQFKSAFFYPTHVFHAKADKAQRKDRLTESQEIQNKKESQEHAMAHRRGTRNGALRNDAVT